MRPIAIAFLFWGAFAQAQWELPTRLQLDGAGNSDRQVSGLADPQTGTDGVSANVLREQRVSHGVATGVDQLSVTLTPAPTAYSPGMVVSLEPAGANTGPVTLNVNGLGSVIVLKNATLPLDSGDLRSGVPVRMVFDGSVFQLVGQWHPACPPGFFAATRDVCVEVNVNDSTTFYGASNACVARGARLCTMGEWYQACSMPGGFSGGLAAFEWVDHAANNNNDAKRMGSNSMGQFDCKYGGLASPITNLVYRCCWDR